jgi:hypothetical protein
MNGDGEPGVLTGETDEIADQLVRFIKLGFTALSHVPVDSDRET